MDPPLAFSLLNALVLPWWGIWLAAPRSLLARRAAGHSAIFIALAAIYTGLITAAIGSGGAGGLGYEGMRAGLSTPLGFLAGWTHYLAFDLFVGAWILRESARLDVEPRPFLLFALMLGPVGLGAFLVRRAWRLRGLGQIGETDVA